MDGSDKKSPAMLVTANVTVPANTDSVRTLCSVANMMAERYKGPETAAMIELVVAEAANNVVRYAYPDRDDGEIRMELAISEAGLELVLVDHGPCFDVTAKDVNEDFQLPEGIDDSLGFGIGILHTVMDEVVHSYVDGSNRLTMKKSV